MTDPTATSQAARQAREALALALLSLQTSGIDEPGMDRAIEGTAAASSGLYAAEAASLTDEAAVSCVVEAGEQLARALKEIQLLTERYPGCEVAASSVARTLALLYPVLQLSLRQRRVRMQIGSVSNTDARELRALAGFPVAPAPTGRSRRPSGPHENERRAQADRRVFLEVEIGLATESHFYTGLSFDMSTGGIFVSTYESAPPGTTVELHFVLPDGHAVNAEGIVRWTREASEDVPPGMGVSFVNLSPESLAHIDGFCQGRPPLYFDDEPVAR